MIAQFKRTEPQSVMRPALKPVSPLVTGLPRTIQFMESRIDMVGDHFTYFAHQAAEELTSTLRSMAAGKQAWAAYADMVRIEFDEDSFQFVLIAEDEALEAVRELELTSETIFTHIAGEHLTDQDNEQIVGEIKSGPLAKSATKVNNSVKKALFLGSRVSGEVYDG